MDDMIVFYVGSLRETYIIHCWQCASNLIIEDNTKSKDEWKLKKECKCGNTRILYNFHKGIFHTNGIIIHVSITNIEKSTFDNENSVVFPIVKSKSYTTIKTPTKKIVHGY